MKTEEVEKLGATKQARKAYKDKLRECLERMKAESYTSIHTMPIMNWQQAHKSSDLTYMLKDRRQVTKMEAKCLTILWRAIKNEYVKEYGFGDILDKIISLRMKIMKHKAAAIAGREVERTFAKLKEESIKKLMKNDTGSEIKLLDIVMGLKQIANIDVDITDCSVYKFYNYLKFVADERRK